MRCCLSRLERVRICLRRTSHFPSVTTSDPSLWQKSLSSFDDKLISEVRPPVHELCLCCTLKDLIVAPFGRSCLDVVWKRFYIPGSIILRYDLAANFIVCGR